MESKKQENSASILTRFQEPGEESNWVAVHDVVMGGVSHGRLRIGKDSIAVFEGTLSLENRGGFASVRTYPTRTDLTAAQGVRIRVRGDGRTYRLRLRTNRNFDGIAYQSEFKTVKDEWIEVELPFSSFVSTFRGRTVEADPLNAASIQQMGVMIADKTPGRFRLEVAWIATYGEKGNDPR